RILMNSKNISKGLLLGASLFLATAAFAGEKASVKVYENVKLNGKTIAPGKYDLEWTGAGPDVQLNIRKGNDTVASAPAKLIPFPPPSLPRYNLPWRNSRAVSRRAKFRRIPKPRRLHLHHRHGRIRFPGIRHNRPSTSRPDPEFRGRRFCPRLRRHRPVWIRVVSDAVHILAATRRVVRPLRKAASHSHLVLRPER